MVANDIMHKAKRGKNDEFFTRLTDISKELHNYDFHGKVVYLNCNDSPTTNFWRYFAQNADGLGFSRLMSTTYPAPAYLHELVPSEGWPKVRVPLQGNGDFRSTEALGFWDEADVVVTNPPFSLFREYMQQLDGSGKEFVILGNSNAITYREVWPMIQSGRMWLGVTGFNAGMCFYVPDGFEYSPTYIHERERDGKPVARVSATCWFTNMDHKKRHEEIPLVQTYSAEKYPRYDNYDAVEVARVKDIPVDYDGVMGVPITFLNNYNPEQFSILGISESNVPGGSGRIWDADSGTTHVMLRGVRKYARIFITHK